MGIKGVLEDTLDFFNFTIMSKEHNKNENKLRNALKNNYNDCIYNLCLGKNIYINSQNYPFVLNESNPYLIIKPGDSAILKSYEYIELDNNTMGLIFLNSIYKKRALINFSSDFIEPNYTGYIIFSLYNPTNKDIILKYGDPVFKILFQNVQRTSSMKKELELTTSKKNKSKKVSSIPLDYVSELKDININLCTNKKIHDLEIKLTIQYIFSFFITILLLIILLKIV